jgi:hypothetical protein
MYAEIGLNASPFSRDKIPRAFNFPTIIEIKAEFILA